VTQGTTARGDRRRWSGGAIVVLVVAAFVVSVAAGMLRGCGAVAETVPSSVMSSSPAAPGERDDVALAVVYVHVAGAVGADGLYPLPAGSRVVDAVAAAGGFAEDADRSAVNLAREVSDGEQILVPVVGEAPPPTSGETGGSADGVVDLNTADLAALDTLPGIGPALAARIVAWRDENGRFASIDDLTAVPGIGEAIVAGLRDRVRV
jgi:competence protein ComEA